MKLKGDTRQRLRQITLESIEWIKWSMSSETSLNAVMMYEALENERA